MGRRDAGAEKASVTTPIAVFVVWCLCVMSAIGVVYTTYMSRQVVFQLEELKREASGMEVVSGQYVLEKSVWSSYSRIEKKAKQEMNMVKPERSEIIWVTGKVGD